MRKIAIPLAAAAFLAVLLGAADQMPQPGMSSGVFKAPTTQATSTQPATVTTPAPMPAAITTASNSFYMIRYDHWSDEDERGYGEFITGIGNANCHTVNDCLHSAGNPFRASDPPGIYFRSDCADLPYVLRAYYAWKRGLPFSYVSAVSPRGHTRDIRYTPNGNQVVSRHDVLSGSSTGYALIDQMRDDVSSATYRMHPDLEDPVPDLYSPAINAKAIHPGTMIYDPNGHVGTVYAIDADGSVKYIDAHPDNGLTRGYYDERFVRSRPGMGAGFKNWRPITLVGATRRSDGVLLGGHVVLARNENIVDFSDEQFYGNGPRPSDDSAWNSGAFRLNGEMMSYYDYVRAAMAGGKLEFDPLKEVREMVDSNCADLHYRADAVNLSLEAGLQNRPEPDRLPANIYGTDGDWETFSTPSRDARLKTAFKEVREKAERFVKMYRAGDRKLVYNGSNVAADMLAMYDTHAALCHISYTRTDGSQVSLSYEQARQRLFLMSFDPYQCVEHRWGATDAAELSTCHDGAVKRDWYAAEQKLRNQIDRTYDAEMDFTLDQLGTPGAGKGVAVAPDTDARGYLIAAAGMPPSAAATR